MSSREVIKSSMTIGFLAALGITTYGCSSSGLQTPPPEPAQTSPIPTPSPNNPEAIAPATPEVSPIAPSSPAEKQPTPNREKREKRALLFACNTTDGKEILLHETETTIDYAFGRPGETPEIDLRVPRDRASTQQWQGYGRWINYSVDVPNDNTVYSVFWGADKLSSRTEAGVNVKINGKVVATVACESVAKQSLRDVQLKPTQ